MKVQNNNKDYWHVSKVSCKENKQPKVVLFTNTNPFIIVLVFKIIDN